MHVQSMTTLTHSVQSGAPRRPLARLAVVAIALLTCAVAELAPFTVTGPKAPFATLPTEIPSPNEA